MDTNFHLSVYDWPIGHNKPNRRYDHRFHGKIEDHEREIDGYYEEQGAVCVMQRMARVYEKNIPSLYAPISDILFMASSVGLTQEDIWTIDGLIQRHRVPR
tara:strand:- start:799 stop:1101 length:303 start_codon:yes stop_codon:yes gene_type:complete